MSGWAWLALAAALGLTELAAPGLYLAFFAVAAALTGVLALISPDAPLWAEAACFAGTSIATVLFGRRLYGEHPAGTADPLLNERAERLRGALVTVAEPIRDGHGRVALGDSVWLARGPDLPAGARARVAAVEDAVLLIEPVEEP